MGKRYLLAAWIILITSVYAGIPKADVPKADSLKAALKNSEGKDRIRLLTETAWAYGPNAPDLMLMYSSAAGNLALKINDLRAWIKAYDAMAYAYYYKGEYDSSLQCLDKSLKKAEAINDPLLLAGIYSTYGIVYDYLDYHKSIDYSLKALELFRRKGDRANSAYVLMTIGGSYDNAGDYDNALKYYLECYNAYQELKQKKGMAYALDGVGRIYESMRNYSKALECYTRSLELFRQTGVKGDIAYALNSLGGLKSLQNKYKEALECDLQALAIYEEMGFKRNITALMHNVGEIYHKMGDFDKALDYYRKSMLLEEDTGNSLGVAVSLNTIGRLFFDKGNYASALDSHLKSLRIIAPSNAPREKGQIYNDLAAVYAKMGNYKSAFEFQNRYIAVKDSLLNEENSRNITNLQARYETETKEKEIDVLRKERELQRLELENKSILISLGFVVTGLFLIIMLALYFMNNNKKKNIEFMQTVINSLTHPFYVMDASDYSLEYYNTAASEKNNLHPLPGTKKVARSLTDKQTELLNMVKLRGNPLTAELDYSLDDGRTVFREVHYFPLFDSRGEVSRIIEYDFDITGRKLAEQAIQKYTDELKVSNASKDKFFSIIAHDLRNPFVAIKGYLDILRDDYDDLEEELLKEIINNLHRSADHTYNLLENLLYWSRAQLGRIEFRPTELDIQEMIDENIMLLEGHARRKSISISCSAGDNVKVFADRNMLNTVLRNLITNSIKYTDKGGAVTVSADLQDDNAIITITDNGIGMNKEELDNLFKIETMTSTPGTDMEKGTGLGLILCREFIIRNRGELSVESNKGEGSRFSFTLPVIRTAVESQS